MAKKQRCLAPIRVGNEFYNLITEHCKNLNISISKYIRYMCLIGIQDTSKVKNIRDRAKILKDMEKKAQLDVHVKHSLIKIYLRRNAFRNINRAIVQTLYEDRFKTVIPIINTFLDMAKTFNRDDLVKELRAYKKEIGQKIYYDSARQDLKMRVENANKDKIMGKADYIKRKFSEN